MSIPKDLVFRAAGPEHSGRCTLHMDVFRSWRAFPQRQWSEHVFFFACTLWLWHELLCSTTWSLPMMLCFSTRPQTNETRMSKAPGQSDSFLFMGQLSQRFATVQKASQHCGYTTGSFFFFVFLVSLDMYGFRGVGGDWKSHIRASPVFLWPRTMTQYEQWPASYGWCWLNICPLSLVSLPTKFLTLWAFENWPIFHLWCLSTIKPAWTPPCLVYPGNILPLQHPQC